MLTNNRIFELEDYYARLLQTEDEAAVQGLYEESSDYFEITTNLPVGSTEAQKLFQALPVNKGYEDKFIIGIFEKSTDTISGVIDFIKNYPGEGVGMLGLLLLHPQHRNCGVGEKIYQALENWWSKQGGHTVRIGVIEYNRKAFKFWQRLGFQLVERRFPYKFGNRESALIVMERSI